MMMNNIEFRRITDAKFEILTYMTPLELVTAYPDIFDEAIKERNKIRKQEKDKKQNEE